MLHEELFQLEQKNLDLQDTVEELISSEDIVTYQKGKYTDDVLACCYELLSHNVGAQNVKAVINILPLSLKTWCINLLNGYLVILLYAI